MKKKGIITMLAILFYAATWAAAPKYSLSEALKKKLVKADIRGIGGHTGKCINISLTNLTAGPLEIYVPTGQQFIPGDTTLQNMMLMESPVFVLNAHQKKGMPVNAMCIQQHDGGPGAQTLFAMGNVSKGHLLGIAQLIDQHDYYDGTGQSAVWCISDGASIEGIVDDDTVKMKILQEFVSKATGQKMPKPGFHNQSVTPRRMYKTTVSFEWTIARESKVTLAVVGADNKPVMEPIKDQQMPAGTHKKEIVLSTEELPEGEYNVILYVNNSIFMPRRITLGPRR